MDYLRTPDEKFNALPDFTYAPKFLESLSGFGEMRVSYLDEGPNDSAETFLCLHGEPTWSYLYRKMIPRLTERRFRVVAPDFFGFGRSDKPTDEAVYTFEFHRNMLLEFITTLDLKNITLVCQDWGGVLGLTLPQEFPERFKRLLVMNTLLGTGDYALPEGFLAWRNWCEAHPDMQIARLMQRSVPSLKPEEAQAYEAPYPDASFKAGVRAFPKLVPDRPDSPGTNISKKARHFWQEAWQGESFMAIGKQDPVIGEAPMRELQKLIRNCPEPIVLEDAGHFVQENGEQVLAHALPAFGLV